MAYEVAKRQPITSAYMFESSRGPPFQTASGHANRRRLRP